MTDEEQRKKSLHVCTEENIALTECKLLKCNWRF